MIATGRKSKSLHKEELTMSETERRIKRNVEEHARVQQMKKTVQQQQSHSQSSARASSQRRENKVLSLSLTHTHTHTHTHVAIHPLFILPLFCITNSSISWHSIPSHCMYRALEFYQHRPTSRQLRLCPLAPPTMLPLGRQVVNQLARKSS